MSDDISEKLDTIIKLQAVALIANIESIKERILFLDKVGLRPMMIAEIIGTTPSHVNVALSQARKKSPKKSTKGGNRV